MKFEDFFDPSNIEHIKAYAHVEKTGAWPEGFIPIGVITSYIDVITAQSKLAHAYIEQSLNNPTSKSIVNPTVHDVEKYYREYSMEEKLVDSENICLLFELHGKDGHIWKLYEDGQIEGFPVGTVIINRATPLLTFLRSKISKN